jgi:hypothetical protein
MAHMGAPGDGFAPVEVRAKAASSDSMAILTGLAAPCNCCGASCRRSRFDLCFKRHHDPNCNDSNFVNGFTKASFTVPVGPLRCLLMMISATPGSLESLL